MLNDADVRKDAYQALYNFCVALDRDPSDADLWRKAARLAAFLRSPRITRYSLEAAIEMDDDPAVDEVNPPSLAEGFAGEQLKQQLQVLDDKIALTHPIMKPFLEKDIPPYLAEYLDPMPFLPDPSKQLAVPGQQSPSVENARLTIGLSNISWTELGMALVNLAKEEGLSSKGISIQLPATSSDEDVQMEVDAQLQLPKSQPPPAQLDVGQVDGDNTEHPAEVGVKVEEPEPAELEPASANDESSKDQGSSRKRSQSAAGIPDTQEDEAADLKRSKRTRRRDTTADEAMDSATFFATQLQPLQAADQNLFQATKNLLENLGVTDRVTLDRIAEVLDSCASDDRTSKFQNPATVDLRNALMNFDEDVAAILLNQRELPQLNLSTFLEHAKSGSQRALEAPAFDDARGLRGFVERLGDAWNTIHDVAYGYVKALADFYTDFKWSEPLRATVIQLINSLDSSIYDGIVHDLEACQSITKDSSFSKLASLAQMLLELHLDVLDRVNESNGSAEEITKVEAKGRLRRWMELVTKVLRMRDLEQAGTLPLRYLWAAVTSTTLTKEAPREHILNCWYSLRDYLTGSVSAEISLPNNSVMPEISLSAADREISKLTTMDFFLGIFQEEMSDPVSVIENLEPVLSPESVQICVPVSETDSLENSNDTSKSKVKKLPITECASQELLDLWKFLNSSSTELRLLLWSRLAEAYGRIKYTTKQFSCFLRSIEVIVADFEGEEYASTPPEARKTLFMGMLKALDDLIIQSLHLALNDNSSFDIIDEDHLRSSMSAIAKVSCMLHVAAMYEDEGRIGILPSPANGSPQKSFLNKLQEMQVRTWSLQYTMLKVGINQHPDIFPKPENDLAEFLAAVHQVLGLRKCCKSSNRIFLKMMRVELLKQKNIENWEDYLGQVLYDLHGLKLGVGVWDVQDHGCEPENLEKRQALQLVEKVAMLANRMSMKDLLKSDLKTTIERMQQAIGSAKSSPQMSHNLRNYTEYLKSPIHPLHMYQALTGGVHLDAVSINTPESAPAKQGWFFLLGMIALTKFKGVDLNRRQTPGATDDLRIAATFLRLQLQYTPDRWDAWFRLAECFDYELEEAVLWTADKMNKERAELVKFQRHAIHSYIMALSHSYAWASNPAALTSLEDDEEALYDMYHEFGMRLYSSSREPFAMEPFEHGDHKRFFIEPEGAGTYKKIVHNQMTDYQVWKFAAHLFRKAMVGKPKDWKNPYMVAKCLWKMYQKPTEELDEKNRRHRPTVQMVLDALEKTIEVVSALPKPRHGQEPILEPHYKIVSVIWKLVKRGDLSPQEATKVLQRQPYSPDHGKEVSVETAEDFKAYIIRCLRYLRDKDKSNWQHRLIIRHARVLFDENTDMNRPDAVEAAKAAFGVLRENMFTKTMVMNVWKCDAERPGRHHVYTERYIRYVVKLLDVMNDRTNMGALLRRIRKKGADFYHFNELWQYCVHTYVKLLRDTFNVPVSEEDVFKTLTPEEFDVVGEKIADWAATPDAENHDALGAMKEAVELKKLNANLMKAGLIDDLIADCYTAVYSYVRPELPRPERTPLPDTTPSSPKSENVPPPPADAVDLKSRLLHTLVTRDKEPSTSSILGSLRAGSSELQDRSEKHSVAGDVPQRAHRVGVGIRRPNIIRKAEQAVQAALRAAEGAAARAGTNGSSTGPSGTKPRVGSISSLRAGRTATRGEDEEDSEGDEDGDVEMKEAEGEGPIAGRRSRRQSNATNKSTGAVADEDEASDVSSPPGSLHDSADDESELSDVPADYEDDAPPALLFPNLRRSVDAGIPGSGEEDETETEHDTGNRSGEEEEQEEEAEDGSEEGDEDAAVEDHEENEETDKGVDVEEHADDEEGEEDNEETEEQGNDGDSKVQDDAMEVEGEEAEDSEATEEGDE